MKTLAFVRPCLVLLFAVCTVFAQSEDEIAVKEVVSAYHNAVIQGNFEATKEFVNNSDTNHSLNIDLLKNENVRFPLKAFTIRTIVFEASKAVVRVYDERTNPRTNQPAKGYGVNHKFFILEKINNNWKITNTYRAEIDFIYKVLSAKTDEEKKTLFRNEKELKVNQIFFEIIFQAANLGDFELSNYYLKLADWFNEEVLKSNEREYVNFKINIFNATAANQRKLGNYATALKIYSEAQILAEKYKLRAVAMIAANMGILYFRQGNIELAEFYGNFALAFMKGADEAVQGNVFNAIYDLLTDVYLRKGDYDKALEYIEKKKEVYSVSKGVVLLRQRKFDESLKVFRASLEVFEKSLAVSEGANYSLAVEAYSGISEIYLFKNESEHALNTARQAVELAQKSQSPEAMFTAYSILGEVLLKLNKLEDAEKTFLTAVETSELARKKTIPVEQSQIRLLEDRIKPYTKLAEIYLNKKDDEKLLNTSERTKSRVLSDSLAGNNFNWLSILDANEKKQEQALRNRLTELNRQNTILNFQPIEDKEKLKLVDAEINTARGIYEGFKNSIYAKYNDLNIRKGLSDTIKLSEIAGVLKSKNEVIIEYMTIGEIVVMVTLTKENNSKLNLQVYPMDLNKSDLAKKVESFRQKLQAKNLDYQTDSRELYKLLLGKAEAQLKGKNSLIIVPDSFLWEVPFQALMPKDNRFLIEDVAINYAPSLTVLREMNKSSGVLSNSPRLLAFGNPELNTDTKEKVEKQVRGGKLESLKDAEKEVDYLGKLYGLGNSKILKNSFATETFFKSEASKFNILHFATHGVLNNQNPMYSSLVLSLANDAKEDGLLEAWELMDMNITADLAVLSACETGRGEANSGEGIVGLSWAFFIAGTPRVVATQWKVDSASTSEVMQNFHQTLRKSSNVAKSLQMAMVKQLKKTRHPFYWAGFVHIGKN
jgi:CHAT domain-containing protein